MEEKTGNSPSGVISDSSRADFQQQNPNFVPIVGPTPPPPSTTVTPASTTALALTTTTATPDSDPTKKKRGRPRKYAPDGTLNPRPSSAITTLSPTPISSSIPLSADYSSWKPRKSKPIELVNNKYEKPATGLSYYVGANFTTHMFTVNAGEDVTMKIMPFSQQGSRAICILSATGSISNVTLRQSTTSGGTLTYEGRFEILSLSGSFMPTENGGTKGRSGGMSISLAGPDGRVVGGGLAGMLIAAGPVQVIMGSFIVMHQAEHKKQKKPRISTASAPPPLPPTFTLTTAKSTPSAAAEEPKQQIYGSSGGLTRPVIQMPNDNSAMNNLATTYHGYANLNKEEDEDGDGGGGSTSLGDDSGDTRSQSNSR